MQHPVHCVALDALNPFQDLLGFSDIVIDFSAGNAFLAPFLDSIPANAMADNVTTLGSNFTLNLTQLLPDNASQYVQYPGSLTTPPCTENILWTIFTNDEPIAFSQVRRGKQKLKTWSC